MSDVTITGTLSNLSPRAGGGTSATLTHPEVQLHVVFPYSVRTAHAHLIAAGERVTVHGDYEGSGIRVTTVEAAGR